MVIKCIIIEDEPIARNILKEFISRDTRLQLAGSFKSAVEGLQHIQFECPDLVFLDILNF
jgi:YesN/AraC family two-component response regulator